MFDDDTVDWCVTCKFNKIMDLYSIRTLELFQRKTILECDVNLLPKTMKYIDYLHIRIDME